MIFLLAILISACASSSPAFCMRYSAYKLYKQGDNIQPWCSPFPIWNQFVVLCLVLTVASWPAYRFQRRPVRWSGIPISLRIFQFVVTHTVKALAKSMKQSRYFSGILLLFLRSSRCWQFDLWFLCLYILNLYIWKFLVHVLFKPSLKDFEHYHASMWNECNCVALAMPFFGIGKKLTFSSPVAAAVFSKFASILSAAL